MPNPHRHFLSKVFGCALSIVIIMVSVASLPAYGFPEGKVIHIPKNSSLSDVSAILFEKHVISSPLLFRVALLGRHALAGDYLFGQPQNLFTVVSRLVSGDQGLSRVKVTIPEGSSIYDIAWIILKKIPDFDAPYFIKTAVSSEGYLFPDTYYFLTNVSPEEVVSVMKKNFTAKISAIQEISTMSERTLGDIVTMASLIEKEATTSEDRRIISGILWKRLDQGMLLQVDPPLAYITSNNTGLISLADTKIDSPYNTYHYKGLPRGPISNPGLDALQAALSPALTKYWYYLSDKAGNIHYAKTYEGHLANKDKYLR